MNNAAPLFGLAAFVSSIALLVHVAASAWLRWKETERTHRSPEPNTARLIAELQDQVARVESTLDAQGTHLERIAEGQRFAARLLAERAPGGSDAASGARQSRVITPH